MFTLEPEAVSVIIAVVIVGVDVAPLAYVTVIVPPLTVNALDIINSEKAQKVEIDYDSISLEFSAGELAGSKFYAYYVIANKNKTGVNKYILKNLKMLQIT